MEHSELFDKARRLYPGTKRGNETEFKNFKRHKDWKKVLSLLEPAILRQIEIRTAAESDPQAFIPCWKHFQTWINQRCWEEELVIQKDRVKQSYYNEVEAHNKKAMEEFLDAHK